jgi:predicted transcriptional regulator of viral defense system
MDMPNNLGESHDSSTMGRLYALAEGQCGLLTAGQAVRAGVPRSSLEYHARPSGQLERCGRGLYRLRRFPPSELAQLWRVYLPLVGARPVFSHDTALWLFGLRRERSETAHLTLARSERWRTAPEGVRLHFASSPPAGESVASVHGLPVMALEVVLVSMLRGSGMSQEVEIAASAALATGLTSLSRLRLEWPTSAMEELERIAQLAARVEELSPVIALRVEIDP